MANLAPRSAQLLALQIVFMVSGATAIVLRLLAMKVRARSFGWHDVSCVCCYICSVGYSTIYCIGSFRGYGEHLTQLTDPEQVTVILKLFFASEFMYNGAIVFMRLAIILLYLALFPQKWFKYLTYAVGSLATLWSLGALLYLPGNCVPTQKIWNPTLPGKCGDTFTIEIMSGGVNLFFDMLLIFMPMPIVWRLQMPTRKKVAVTSVFSLGLLNIGINVGRIVQPIVSDFDDFTYSTSPAAILAGVEILSGILVACVPTYGPLFQIERYRSKYQAWTSRRALRKSSRRYGTQLPRETQLGVQDGGVEVLTSPRNLTYDEESGEFTGSRIELQRLQGDNAFEGQTRTRAAAWAEPQRDFVSPGSRKIGVKTDLDVYQGPLIRNS